MEEPVKLLPTQVLRVYVVGTMVPYNNCIILMKKYLTCVLS